MIHVPRLATVGLGVGLVTASGCESPEAGPPLPIVVAANEIQVLGTSESVTSIVDLMPLDDDSVWILNNADPFLVHLSADGEVVEVQDRRGEGPGELSWPSTLVRDDARGRVWVLDSAYRDLRLVDGGEDLTESIDLAAGAEEPVHLSSYEWLWMNNGGRIWMRVLDGDVVYARPSFSSPWIYSLWATSVVRVEPQGPAETLVSTFETVGSPETRFPGATRFLPYPLWTVCADGALALYDPNAHVLRRFSPRGDATDVVDLPAERAIPVTTDRIFSAVYPQVLRNRVFTNRPDEDEFYRLVERDYEDRADEFAAVFPEFAHIDCDEAGSIWLQRFDPTSGQMGRGSEWLRISSEGVGRTVEFPDSFRPMRFYGDRVWGISRDEFEVDHAAWTELPELSQR